MIGPGKAFDTDRFFVVSTNLLGGCRGTTGPSSIESGDRQAVRVGLSGHHRRRHGARPSARFSTSSASSGSRPSPADRSAACRRSSGRSCIPIRSMRSSSIASTHALQPQGVAWNAIARNAIMADPDWQGGHYYGTGRAPDAGMGVARMVGHITYLSAQSLGDKFGRRLQFADDIRYTLTEPEFEVESYLRHQADTFVKRFDANTYLYTSRALTYFDLARQYGSGTPGRRAARRVGADAADRVQLRLAVSAVRLRGARRRAARARQGRRAARHRGAVRPRLLPARGGPADADDSALPRAVRRR